MKHTYYLIALFAIGLLSQNSIAAPGLMAISYYYEPIIPEAFATEHTVIERGKDYIITDLGNGQKMATLGQSEYVLDPSDGTYKPHIIKSNANSIVVINEQFPLRFDKNDCTFTVYQKPNGILDGVNFDINNSTSLPDVFIDYEAWSIAYNSGSGWTVYDTPEALGCTYDTTSGADPSITVHRTHPKGTMDTTYSIVDGKYLKPTSNFTNDITNGFVNTQVAPVLLWKGVNITGLINNNGNDVIDTFSVGVTETFTKAQLSNKQVFLKDLAGNSVLADLTLGYDDLLAVQVTKRVDGKFDITWAFTKSTISLGETVTIDPTFGYDSGTYDVHRHQTNCGGAYNSEATKWLGSSGDCWRGTNRWDTTTIPDTITSIDNVQVRYDFTDLSTVTACDFYHMAGDPNTQNDQTDYGDAQDGTLYGSDTQCATTGTDYIFDLGTTADSDLYTAVTGAVNWWAVGISENNDDDTNNGVYGRFDSNIELQVTYTEDCIPDAPTGLSAESSSTSQIDLSWTAPTNCTNQTVEVQQSATGAFAGEETTLYSSTPKTSHSDTGLSGNEDYFYRVRYQSDDLAWGAYSSTASDFTTPGVPTSPTVTSTTSTSIGLSWTAPTGSGTLTYKIEEKIGAGSWTTRVASHSGTTYTATSLDPGTLYTYRVSAINSDSTGAASSEFGDTTYPGTPTSLVATASAETVIGLVWVAPSTGAYDGFKIERETPVGGGFSVLVADTGTTDVTYSDTTVVADTVYNYRVTALNGVDTGTTPSNESSDQTYGSPNQVTGLSATASSSTVIGLSWTAPDANGYAITGYKIERESPTGGGFSVLVADTGSTGTTYSNTGLTFDTDYNYKVSAINSYGTGAASAASSDFTHPGAPTSLTVNDCYHTCTTQLNLEWTAPSPAGRVNGYKIDYESPVGGGFSTLVANTTNTLTYYNHTGLTAGVFYNYKVYTLNPDDTSVASNAYVYSPHKLPDAVDDLAVTTNSILQFLLSWTAPELYGTLSGYMINYTTPAGDPLTIYTSDTGNSDVAAALSGLDPTTEHTFRVSAVTIHGTNVTGANLANATMTNEIQIGDISISTDDNELEKEISYVLYNVDTSTDDVQVRFDSSLTVDCTVSQRVAGTSTNYTSISETSAGSYVYHNFTVTNAGNDILDFDCWDTTDTALNGQYSLTQSLSASGTGGAGNVPLFSQINNFTGGLYGTEGDFAGIDLITMIIVIVSMLGFNRTHPALGVGVMAFFLGAAWYYEIVPWTSGVLGAIAVVLVLAIGQGVKRI